MAASASGSVELTLPPLPYAYDALEPHISKDTMREHHAVSHAGYTKKANAILAKLAEADSALAAEGLDSILLKLDKVPEAIRTKVRNFGGGFVNHAMFFQIMGPGKGGEPTGDLKAAIDAEFGDFAKFKADFTALASTGFASCWTWLYVDTTVSPAKLALTVTPNQDTPAMEAGKHPILCLDEWEHAFVAQFGNGGRGKYIESWWNCVNWDEVARRFSEATK